MNRRNSAEALLLKAAARVQRAAACSAGDDCGLSYELTRELSCLREHCLTVERLERFRVLARTRGWLLAAERLRVKLYQELRALQEVARTVMSHQERVPRPPLSLRSSLDDLAQLTQEFEHVEYNLKQGMVIARTESIELEGVKLGPFAIELHLGRLHGRRDASCFHCVALKPNPAGSNQSVTHPHVQDRQLCAGDASMPIISALAQGRICDAFCLVRSVLQTYNRGSPYVSLDEWEGIRCSDCGYAESSDRTCYCEHCEKDYCDDCMSCCDACDGSCCRSCLEQDEQRDTDCCPSCRTDCADCGRVVTREDAKDDLCPQCRQEQEEDAQEQEPQPTQPQEQHEQHPQQQPHDPGQPAGAGQSPPTSPDRQFQEHNAPCRQDPLPLAVEAA